MAVTTNWYGLGLNGLLSAVTDRRVDFVGDAIKVQLTTVTYTPNQDTDDFEDDVTNEVSGTGYTTGGITLAGNALTYDTGTNEVRIDSNDWAWTSATFTARYAIMYVDTAGAATTDPLLTYTNFGGDEQVTSGNFTVQVHADGIAKITAS